MIGKTNSNTIIGGGSSDSGGKYLVTVIDYDGTVLKQDHLNDGKAFTLPEPPKHSRLTFQKWVSATTIVNNTVTVDRSDITIGATYTTVSGLNEFDIELNKLTGLSFTLQLGGVSSTNVDWGDGTTTNDGTTTHTYANYGKYTIKTNNTEGYTSSFFGQNSNIPNQTCVSALLMMPISVSNFAYCQSLKSVSINPLLNSTDMISSAFNGCLSLSVAILPDKTGDASSLFTDCYSLRYIVFLGTYYPTNIFSNNYNLTSIQIPSDETTARSPRGGYFWAIKRLKIPNVTSTRLLTTANGVIEYDYTSCTTVPTLEQVPLLIQLCKIIVPNSLYDAWITTSNWSSLADYIYKASEVA